MRERPKKVREKSQGAKEGCSGKVVVGHREQGQAQQDAKN